MTKINSPAKLNLGLSILRKLDNGYHEIKTIFAQTTLFDTLEFIDLKEDLIKIDSNANIPCDEKNTVYQAIQLLKKRSGIKKGLKIFINKKIPFGAGLGGGSSNAAITLKYLNNHWKLNLSKNELIEIAKQIGADVPYPLFGGVKLEYQGGKQGGTFIKLKNLPECKILIIVPDFSVSTKEAYGLTEYDLIGKNDLSELIDGINEENLEKIAKSLHNDFEIWITRKHPEIKEIKQNLVKSGAMGSIMSGSGSSVFGIFQNEKLAKKAYEKLKKDYKNCFLVDIKN